MLNVKCLRCGAEADTENHADPDSAVKCSCCTVDHRHGECRPVQIMLLGPVYLTASAG